MSIRFPDIVERGFEARRTVYDALETLLETKSYSAITTRDLLQASGISRTTFYRHFGGKEGVVSRLFREFALASLDQTGRSMSWYEGNLTMTRYLYDARSVLAKVSAEGEGGLLPRLGRKARIAALTSTIEDARPSEVDDDLRFEIEALAIVEPMLMTAWLTRGFLQPPERMALLLDGIAPQRLQYLANSIAHRPTGMAVPSAHVETSAAPDGKTAGRWLPVEGPLEEMGPINQTEYSIKRQVVEAAETAYSESPTGDTSVKEVCERAQISRATFYRHFDGKIAIANWCFMIDAARSSRSIGTSMSLRESHARVLQSMIDHPALFENAMRSKSIDSFRYTQIRALQRNLLHALFQEKNLRRTEELEFQIDYTSKATVIMVCQWFTSGMPYPVETLLDRLELITPAKLYRLLSPRAAPPPDGASALDGIAALETPQRA